MKIFFAILAVCALLLVVFGMGTFIAGLLHYSEKWEKEIEEALRDPEEGEES